MYHTVVVMAPERRDVASREALLRRVYSEFAEIPCLCLTGPQARRLFGLRTDIAARVLWALVDAHQLFCGIDGRYRLSTPAQEATAHSTLLHNCPC